MIYKLSGENFGDYFRRLRRARGFKSQKLLAEASGVSQATISRIEEGSQKPQDDTLRSLSKTLGVKYLDLIEASNDFDGLQGEKVNEMRSRYSLHESLDDELERLLVVIGDGGRFQERDKFYISGLLDGIDLFDSKKNFYDYYTPKRVAIELSGYDSIEFKAETIESLKKYIKTNNIKTPVISDREFRSDDFDLLDIVNKNITIGGKILPREDKERLLKLIQAMFD